MFTSIQNSTLAAHLITYIGTVSDVALLPILFFVSSRKIEIRKEWFVYNLINMQQYNV